MYKRKVNTSAVRRNKTQRTKKESAVGEPATAKGWRGKANFMWATSIAGWHVISGS